MPAHIGWSKIALLHNVVRTLNYLHDLDGRPLPTLTYKAKVKLHGTNCAVQVREKGVFCQSRNQMLELPRGDFKGFATWVHGEGRLTYFQSLPKGITVFGEWCGPGIEKGMAISNAKGKVFAVFALQAGYGETAQIIYDPKEIKSLLGETPEDMYILPWQGEPVIIDYTHPGTVTEDLNARVLAVEREDPWVKAVFGISGLGEGLVFYPVGENIPTDPEGLARFMFKAKGDKHKTVATKQAVQVAPEVADSIESFVGLVVTEARLMQGLTEACGGEAHMRHTRDFIQWVSGDVQKETEAELEASKLTWNQVHKAVQAKARTWLRDQVG